MKHLKMFILIFFYIVSCSDQSSSPNNDISPPEIISVFPIDGAKDVSILTNIYAVFSENIDANSINQSNVLLKIFGQKQKYSLSFHSDTLKIIPDSSLHYSSTYQVYISTEIKDKAGNRLKEPKEWYFATVSDTDTTIVVPTKPDTIPPVVTSISPANGATGVSNTNAITVTFSEAVENVTASTFLVKADSNPVTGNVALNGLTATFTPASPYPYRANVIINLTSAITDTAGNALAPYSFSFTTGYGDTTSPSVVSTIPTDGATGISNTTAITATFSEAVENVTASTFLVKADGVSVSGSVALNGLTAVFSPTDSLPYEALVDVNLTSAITDTAGNALAPYSFSFTVEDEPIIPDTTPPEIIATDPAQGATGVAVNDTIYVTWSEPIENLNGNTVFSYADGNPFYCTFYYNYGDTVAYFVPNLPMPYGAYVDFVFTDGVTDTAGNQMTEYHLNFTVEDEPPSWGLLPDGYEAEKVVVDANGNVYFGGNIYNSWNQFVVKFDANGELQWLTNISAPTTNTGYGFHDIDIYGNSVIIARVEDDANYNFVNYLASYNIEDGSLVWQTEVNVSGTISAIKVYGSNIYSVSTHTLYVVDANSGIVTNSVYLPEAADDIDVDEHGIYIIGGFFNLAHQDADYRLLVYNHNLTRLNAKDWGTDEDENTGDVRIANNAVYFSGSSGDFGVIYPVLIKCDFSGEIISDSVYTNLVSSSPVWDLATDRENLYMVPGPNKFSADLQIIYAMFPGNLSRGLSVAYFAGRLYVADGTNVPKVYDAGTGAQIFP